MENTGVIETAEQDTILLSPLNVIWDRILGVASFSTEVARRSTRGVASFFHTAQLMALQDFLPRFCTVRLMAKPVTIGGREC